ncbi:MAG: LD-carboxypeptidase [Novosphingobium sp.]|nr:LD-carboxypeptidase [Novosphingobium sp.]MCP5379573.1 LD-carboxypeptidase [Novosphingobium sp.]MCP5388660.1 LD-carboxypeptidase [Novosphingobium sp.]
MSRIAICAPATPITRDHAQALQTLAAAEFPQHRLFIHDQCFAVDGHFAGPDELRLAALLECANDPAFDAVWFAKGGYGSNRIAERAIMGMGPAARSKTWVGFSDMGYLLGALYRAGIGRPVHAPMPVSVQSDAGKDAVRRVLRWFDGDNAGLEPSLDGRPAVAFNLMTLAMLCGTELMPDLTGHVVMVEEVSEHLYAIDRLFFHVTAHLPGIAGLRLGRISDVPENDRPFGAQPEEIARYWCARRGIAFLGAADIGHDAANRIVPFGLAGDAAGQ